jgi:hypothetical protein
MQIFKQSLVAMLLELGEENAAFLLARSALPEVLDTDRDLDVLGDYGLDADDVTEIIRSAVEAVAGGVDAKEHGERLRRTVSKRWADLVGHWVADPAAGPG